VVSSKIQSLQAPPFRKIILLWLVWWRSLLWLVDCLQRSLPYLTFSSEGFLSTWYSDTNSNDRVVFFWIISSSSPQPFEGQQSGLTALKTVSSRHVDNTTKLPVSASKTVFEDFLRAANENHTVWHYANLLHFVTQACDRKWDWNCSLEPILSFRRQLLRPNSLTYTTP